MTTFEPWTEALGREVIAPLAGLEGAVLPMLHAVQARFGRVPREAVAMIAAVLNLSRAEVHGAMSFYHDFKSEPAPGRVIKVCRAESCQAKGGEAAARALLAELGIGWGGSTADGRIGVEAVYCLGLCAVSPAALADRRLLGRVDGEALVAAAKDPPPPPIPPPHGGGGGPRRGGGGDRCDRLRVFVPRDSAAVAVGADEVAAGIARLADVEIIRTGSRGLAWLEPLVEVETAAGRIGYGPVSDRDVPELLAAGMLHGGEHPLRVGRPDDQPWLADQTRLIFARCGITDPLSLADYRAHGGFEGLARARAIGPSAVVEAVIASGLRGRGGAGFPTGVKWRTAAEAPGGPKYVVCNADEGDSGTFADRMVMEGDPFLLIEGMAIAAHAVGAAKAFVYSRSEYPLANATFARAIEVARGSSLLDGLDIELRVGGGAYVCGEETSLLESLEGKRGQVRAKPPLPAHKGLFAAPTVVNNVLSLAATPWILANGAQAYAALGIGRSRGTQPIQLAGNVKRPGLYEAPFGLTLGEIVHTIGGGTASGRPVKAVQCGGPLGAYFPPSLFDTVYDYEAFAARDGLIGHGGVVVFDDTADMAAQARFAFEFCAVESCGKCTPCRIGAVRGVETMDEVIAGREIAANLALVEDLCHTLKWGSLCALGGFTPYPVMSAITHWPEDFGRAGLADDAMQPINRAKQRANLL